ncbi:prokaryotic type I DNA topoisomerase [Atractiella rhizophila]|nr:prokaryotic type I DNA topoisomerase [Atractiella rhizophila]
MLIKLKLKGHWQFLKDHQHHKHGQKFTSALPISAKTSKGLIVLERNYLDVYPYDKWEGNHIPDFTKGEKFIPDVCEMKHGRTTKPSLLTEADLVGTDATIGEHIAKIIERLYVMKHKEGRIEYLSPSTLGIGLVRGYNQVGLEKSLSKPQLRRETELRMVQVCEGTKSKAEMIAESLEEYKDVFMRAKRSFNVIANEVLKYLEGRGDGQPGAAAPDGDGGGGGRRGGGGGGGGGRGGGGGGRRRDDGDDDEGGGGGGAGGRRGGGTGTRGKAKSRSAPKVPPSQTPGSSFLSSSSIKPLTVPVERSSVTARASTSNTDADAPPCQCGIASVERTVVKEGPNKGRVFFRCANGESGCKFFHWADGVGNNTKRPSDSQEEGRSKRARTDAGGDAGTVRCQCGLEAVLLTVAKEGPNMGRQFYKCSKLSDAAKCSFFQWTDEPARTPTKDIGLWPVQNRKKGTRGVDIEDVGRSRLGGGAINSGQEHKPGGEIVAV